MCRLSHHWCLGGAVARAPSRAVGAAGGRDMRYHSMVVGSMTPAWAGALSCPLIPHGAPPPTPFPSPNVVASGEGKGWAALDQSHQSHQKYHPSEVWGVRPSAARWAMSSGTASAFRLKCLATASHTRLQ